MSKEKIKEIYKKLAKKHHPDKGGDTEYFKLIQLAYEKLMSVDTINKTYINTIVEYSLEDLYNGCTKIITYWDDTNDDKIKKEKKFILNLSRGFNTDATIRGNLRLIFVEKPHSVFKRSGHDLIIFADINVKDINSKKVISFIHLDGKKINIKIDGIITHNEVKLIEGKGLPKSNNEYGNLYIKFNHIITTN